MADETPVAPAPAAEPTATTVATAPVEPSGERPRDDKGRFTKENIERAAGITPEPAPTSTAPAPVVPAVAETVTVPPVAAPAAETPADDLKGIDDFLAANSGTVPAPVAAPAAAAPAPAPINPQEQIQQLAQAPEFQQVIHAAQVHHALNDTLARGDINSAVGMFAPQVQQALAEHFFQQNREAWTQRIVDEANGVKADPRVDMLSRQLEEMRHMLTSRQQQELDAQQKAEQTRNRQAFVQRVQTFTNGLFDAAKMKDSPNRPWLEARMWSELQANPQAMANIQAGRFGDIGVKFRELYSQFRPMVQAVAAPPQAAAQPTGAAQLMAAPSGTSTSPAPVDDLVVDGRVSGKGIVRRLAEYIKAG